MEEMKDTAQHILLERTELVIEDNTIYEIDLDCMDCLNRKEKKN